MLVYYAHPISMYDSVLESTDIAFLTRVGLKVVNPAKLSEFVEPMNSTDRMNYFYRLVRRCDCLAFRSFVDGKIGAGVQFEIGSMETKGGMIFELRPPVVHRALTIKDTKKRLQNQRNLICQPQ